MARDKREWVDVKVRVEKADYEYLKELLKRANLSVSGTVADVVGSMVRFFRGVFGDDLSKLDGRGEFYLRQMVRMGLVELSMALENVGGVEGGNGEEGD